MLITRHRMVVALMAGSVSAVAAQGRVSCPGGEAQSSLGQIDLDCVQCTLHTGTGSNWVEYGAEPTVKRSQSYNANSLKAGDVIVSIDGALITTAVGARRFTAPSPSRAVNVVVRRNGQPVTLSITPTLRCPVGVASASIVQMDSAIRQRFSAFRDSSGGFIVRRSAGDTVYFPRRDSLATGVLRARLDSVIRERAIAGGGSSAIGFQLRDSTWQPARVAAGGTISRRGAAADSAKAQRDYVAGRGAGAGGGFAGGTAATGMAPRRIGSLMADRVADSAMAATDSAIRRNYVSIRGGAGGAAARTYSFGRGSRLSDSVAPGGFLGTAEPATMSSGWLGFGFDCSNCSVETGPDGRRVWHFPTAPAIAGVEAGSAAEFAGLQVGDVVREIDGVSLTWPAGAARFSAIKPGQKVKLTIVRKGKAQEVTMTARARTTRT